MPPPGPPLPPAAHSPPARAARSCEARPGAAGSRKRSPRSGRPRVSGRRAPSPARAPGRPSPRPPARALACPPGSPPALAGPGPVPTPGAAPRAGAPRRPRAEGPRGARPRRRPRSLVRPRCALSGSRSWGPGGCDPGIAQRGRRELPGGPPGSAGECACARVRVFVRARVSVHVCACVCLCARARDCACFRVRARVPVRLCVCARVLITAWGSDAHCDRGALGSGGRRAGARSLSRVGRAASRRHLCGRSAASGHVISGYAFRASFLSSLVSQGRAFVLHLVNSVYLLK